MKLHALDKKHSRRKPAAGAPVVALAVAPAPSPAGDSELPVAPGRRALRIALEALLSIGVALAFFSVFLAALNVIFPSSLGIGAATPGAFLSALRRELAGNGDAGSSANAHPPVLDGVLTVLSHEVKTRPAGAIAWTGARSNARLGVGDAVHTLSAGTALLAFDASGRFQLGRNTLMVVRGPEDAGDIQGPILLVLEGELFGDVGAMAGGKQVAHAAGLGAPASAGAPPAAQEPLPVRIATPAGTVAIAPSTAANTQFRVVVRPDRSAVVSTYKGAVAVDVGGRTVQVGPNQFVTLDANTTLSAPRRLPEPPALAAPRAGALFHYRTFPPQVEFKWHRQPAAEAYRIVVASDREFQSVVWDQQVATTDLTHGNLKAGTYYWHVSTIASGAESAPSPPLSMQVTQSDAPPPLQVDFPTETVHATSCTITGTASPGTRIFVAGQAASVDGKGRFACRVELQRGFNVLVVEALDQAGNVTYSSKMVEASY